MHSVAEHYSKLLAPVYLWMSGGVEAALEQGAADISSLGPADGTGLRAVDLGAGFGMHAIPLARNGYAVTAIDTSALLLGELRKHGAGQHIRVIQGNLLDFRAHLDAAANLVLCMGDTVTHLQEAAQVERLFEEVSQALAPDGRFVLTFRDYTHPAVGDARFIPVRSDADRILTCFLEESPTHMIVHDVLHEREGSSWRMRVSSYKKLRLSPEWVLGALERAGLNATLDRGPRGMLRVIATGP